MAMSNVTKECEKCGGILTEDERCVVCGAEDLSMPPSKAQDQAHPGSAALVDKATKQRYLLVQSVSKIGRDQTNSIALVKDNYISRHHAWVLFIKGAYWVEDLGSTNGTLLNGELISERKQMSPGDCLKIGRTELTFEVS